MRKIQFNEETISEIRSFIESGHTVEETCNKFTIKSCTLRRVMFENGIDVYYKNKSCNKKAIDEELIQLVCGLYANTNMRQEDIVKEAKIEYYVYKMILDDNFTKEYQDQRKARLYSVSKLGDKNPMTGKCGEQHPRYNEFVEDGNGYLMILKPDWYTGRAGSKYVFYHSVVMCQALGITEIPKGFIVHHIDGDKMNNDINNLALTTISGHGKIHALYRNLCKVQRLSDNGVGK